MPSLSLKIIFIPHLRQRGHLPCLTPNASIPQLGGTGSHPQLMLQKAGKHKACREEEGDGDEEDPGYYKIISLTSVEVLRQ